MKRHEPYTIFFVEKHEISYALDGNDDDDDDAMLEKCDQIRATATMSMTVVVEILRNYINRNVILHYLFAEQVFLNWKFKCVSIKASHPDWPPTLCDICSRKCGN
jgi:hypothetical protein